MIHPPLAYTIGNAGQLRDVADRLDDGLTHMVDADSQDMTTVFQEAGFEQAGTEVRFYGETHSPDDPHIFSSFYELGSEDGARIALDWLVKDAKKPCPESCATVLSDFDVAGIPDSSGARRLTTAEAIEAAGTPNQIPRDDYLVAFTVGSSVYTVNLAGPPGSVTEQQAREIASAYYDRLAGD